MQSGMRAETLPTHIYTFLSMRRSRHPLTTVNPSEDAPLTTFQVFMVNDAAVEQRSSDGWFHISENLLISSTTCQILRSSETEPGCHPFSMLQKVTDALACRFDNLLLDWFSPAISPAFSFSFARHCQK